jgi:hypothetical protein
MALRLSRLLLSLLATAPLLGAAAAGAVTLRVIPADEPGEGFNDPTPVAPVGGNPGTTLGEQRRIAVQFAADLWSATLEGPEEIRMRASFDPLPPCFPTGGTVAFAEPRKVYANFPGARLRDVWYPAALADRLAGTDLDPGEPEIVAQLNSELGTPGCLAGAHWYYGLDNRHGRSADLVTTMLHELGHGLGLNGFTSVVTGENLAGLPDIYSVLTYDLSARKAWNEMTDAERVASATNTWQLVWSGPETTAAVPRFLQRGTPALTVLEPAAIAGAYALAGAEFGPPLAAPGVTAPVARALDAADEAGPSATDACSPLSRRLDRRIALVDRGTCPFTVKARHAQEAGAVAVVAVDDGPDSPPRFPLAGEDPAIAIPVVRISRADGRRLQAALGQGRKVVATVGINPRLYTGASLGGQVLLSAPYPVFEGSSVSHWDDAATPDLLLEPLLTAGMSHRVDLTLPALHDLGWAPDEDGDGFSDAVDGCGRSIAAPTVVLGGCDSRVANARLGDGCTVADAVAACAYRAGRPTGAGGCAATLGELGERGILGLQERGRIERCLRRL